MSRPARLVSALSEWSRHKVAEAVWRMVTRHGALLAQPLLEYPVPPAESLGLGAAAWGGRAAVTLLAFLEPACSAWNLCCRPNSHLITDVTRCDRARPLCSAGKCVALCRVSVRDLIRPEKHRERDYFAFGAPRSEYLRAPRERRRRRTASAQILAVAYEHERCCCPPGNWENQASLRSVRATLWD